CVAGLTMSSFVLPTIAIRSSYSLVGTLNSSSVFRKLATVPFHGTSVMFSCHAHPSSIIPSTCTVAESHRTHEWVQASPIAGFAFSVLLTGSRSNEVVGDGRKYCRRRRAARKAVSASPERWLRGRSPDCQNCQLWVPEISARQFRKFWRFSQKYWP